MSCPDTRTTPLHVAAFHDSVQCLDFLLSVGCDPNARDGSGEVPLHLAAKSGSLHGLEALIHTKHVLLDLQDNWGRTPLIKAIIYNKRKASKSLLAAGCDVNTQDNTGLSPLHVAASYGQRNLIDRLMRMGADLDAVDRKGRTPVCSAVNGSHFSSVLTLLKHGAKTTYGDNQTIVYDAFIKLVHAKSGNNLLNMRVTSLVLSAHGSYLPVHEWEDMHLNERDIDITPYAKVLPKMAACLKANAHRETGQFPFETFFSEKPAISTLQDMCTDKIRWCMMGNGKNVIWACDTLDINPVLKDIILINNILGF